MNRRFAFLPVFGAAAGLLCLATACQDQASRGPESSHSGSAKPLNPQRSLLLLRERYQHRQYAKMTSLVTPAARDSLFRLLASVDRLGAVNHRVRSIIEKQLGTGSADRWDLAALKENLGVFSDEVKIIDTSIEADRASVAYQVGDTLPLRSATWVRHNKTWQYQPELIDDLPREIIRLSKALERLADALEAKDALSPTDIDSEYRYRVVPRIEQIAALRQ